MRAPAVEETAVDLPISEYIKVVVALFVIVDPVGNAPIFLGLTEGQTAREKNRTAWTASAVTVVALVGSALAGSQILYFFGIRIPSFQVAGGLLLLLTAISMLQAKMSATRQSAQEADEAGARESVAVVPLAIPLCAGPGAIATAVLYGHQMTGAFNAAFLIAACVVVGVSLYLSFLLSGWLGRHISRTGLNVMTRLAGIILAALGVEFIAKGMIQLLPGLGG